MSLENSVPERTVRGEPTPSEGYRLPPGSVAVDIDDRDTALWLREFLAHWCLPTDAPPERSGGEPPVEIRLRTLDEQRFTELTAALSSPGATRPATERHPFFRLDQSTVELPLRGRGTEVGPHFFDPDHGVLLRVRHGRFDLLVRERRPRSRIVLLRLAREVLCRRRPDRLDLHAAAFAHDDTTVVICGAKRSGKTSLLLHALTAGAVLVANDRVLVDVAGQPTAWGVPTLSGIREGTLERYPRLRRSSDERPVLRHSGERGGADARKDPAMSPDRRPFALSPAQLAERMGTQCGTGIAVGTILFPRIVPEGSLSLRAIDAAEVNRRLVAALYGPATPEPSPLTLPERVAGGELSAWRSEDPLSASAASPPDHTGSARRLAVTTAGFEVLLGPSAYSAPPEDFLRRVVGALPPSSDRSLP